MSHRSRPSRVRPHLHCDSCYSRRCRARVEPPVCCALTSCRLLCGAAFHLCKEEEHLLLCPNVRVPCLNVEYGCPATMTRSWRAAHLRVCPASVVSCSMEWNRWPAEDCHAHPNLELHRHLLREEGEEEREGRRWAAEKEGAKTEKEAAAREPVSCSGIRPPVEGDEARAVQPEPEPEPSQEECEALARSSAVDSEVLEAYSAWERMFSMEMGGCRVAGRKGNGLGPVVEEEDGDAGSGAMATGPCTGPIRQTGSARVSAPPVSQWKSCVVYEPIEPMKIITVRTFNVPTSYAARHCRIRNPWYYKRESRAVDTSDLGVALEDMPVWEEVQASLLCSLEKEQRGHLIAEASSMDTLLHDEGTQTYNFLSAPFRHTASLADLTEHKPRELHLQLQVEGVTNRHHKASSAFTFLCGRSFQRREYGKHFRNVHSDIQMCVNGWFEQRCPLAYLGCTYSQGRFQPSTHKATVTYNQELGSFSLCPTIPGSLSEGSLPSGTPAEAPLSQRKKGGGGEDSLSALPYEVLCHMASFLDSLSLSQLALVSRLMREVCSSQLVERGMVTLRWERKSYSRGGAKWRAKQKVWQFSTLFSPVDKWCFQDIPPMSEHLKVCPYYQKESRTERVRLPRIREGFCSTPSEEPSLLGLFKKKTIIM